MSALSFFTHPVWHYSVRRILQLVREDWEGVGTRRELEDIIAHAEVHSAYRRSGYDQMTSRQKYIWKHIWKQRVAEMDAEEGLSRDAKQPNAAPETGRHDLGGSESTIGAQNGGLE